MGAGVFTHKRGRGFVYQTKPYTLAVVVVTRTRPHMVGHRLALTLRHQYDRKSVNAPAMAPKRPDCGVLRDALPGSDYTPVNV